MKLSIFSRMKLPLVSLFTALLPVTTLAASQFETIPEGPTAQPSLFLFLIDRIANWFFAVIIVVSVIFFLMSAWGFLTSSGNAEKATKAKIMLMYAAIGVAVAVLARGIVTIVKSIVLP